jgi:TP901-1 family phage major tail protein
MAAQKGKDLLLKISDGAGGFVTIAGLRTRRLALNADTIDVTDSESAGRWRELLAGAGLRRASVSGTGIFKDQASDALLRQVFFDGLNRDWRIVIPAFGVLTGPFQISNLDYRGEHATELTFDISLDSAGALTFTADGS